MKEFFVIGNQTSKSLSPLIFNHWFKKYKIDAKYKFVEVKKGSFDKVLNKKIKNKKVYGFNVTVPYKKKINKLIGGIFYKLGHWLQLIGDVIHVFPCLLYSIASSDRGHSVVQGLSLSLSQAQQKSSAR